MNDFYLGIYEKATPPDISWQERLAAIKEAGYSFMEISIDESDIRLERLDWSTDRRHELLRISQDIGLPIRTMCLSGHRKYPLGSEDPAKVKQSLEIMDKAIDFAADMGIRIVQLAGYDVYYEESTESTRKRYMENIHLFAEMASQRSVIMGLETMETPFMNTVQKAMQVVNEVNSPYLNVYPDTGNITNAIDDIEEDILTGRGKIVAAHLKETVPNVFRNLSFGDGHVDFVKAIQVYKSIGVNMFNAEFWYNKNKDWKKEIKHSIDFLTDKYIEATNS